MRPPQKAVMGGVIAFAAALVLLVFALLPFFWHASLRDEAAALQSELDLLKAKLAQRSGQGGSILTGAQPLESMFLSGNTAGTILASFQERVGATSAVAGLAVLRMQPLPVEESGGVTSYRLSVDVTGSLEQLRAFLVDIEAILPMVIVSGFDIGPQSDGEDGQAYPSEDLAASLRLEAYAWKGTP